MFFYLFSKNLSQSFDLSYKFNKLIQVNWDSLFLLLFFNWFFFDFILQYWVGWKLKFLFYVIFYGVILISWPSLRVWPRLTLFIFWYLFWVFFYFDFWFFFYLLLMRLSQSHDPTNRFDRLIRVNSVYFFSPFLIKYFFSISPSNNLIFFSRFHPWILSYLEFELHNSFLFSFY